VIVGDVVKSQHDKKVEYIKHVIDLEKDSFESVRRGGYQRYSTKLVKMNKLNYIFDLFS
jgi:hypothetical protein